MAGWSLVANHARTWHAFREHDSMSAGGAPPSPPSPPGSAGPVAPPEPAAAATPGAPRSGRGRLVMLAGLWVLFTLGAAVWAIGTTVDPTAAPVADGGGDTSGATGFGSLAEDAASDGPVGFSALDGGGAPDAGAEAEADNDADADVDADGGAPADQGATGQGGAGGAGDARSLDDIDLGPVPGGHVRQGEAAGGFVLYLPEGWELTASDEERFVYQGPEGTPYCGDVLMVERAHGVASGVDDLDALRAHHARILAPFDEVEILAADDELVRDFVVGPRVVYSATTYRAVEGRAELLARTEIVTASDTDVISVTYSSPAGRFNDNFAANRTAFDSFEVAW